MASGMDSCRIRQKQLSGRKRGSLVKEIKFVVMPGHCRICLVSDRVSAKLFRKIAKGWILSMVCNKIFFLIIFVALAAYNPVHAETTLVLSCSPDNDLYNVLISNRIKCLRYDSPEMAIENASDGAGLLILADGYPDETTTVSSDGYMLAEKKRLRLYVEFPSQVPGLQFGAPRESGLERAVIASDFFGKDLPKLRILSLNAECFVPVEVDESYICLLYTSPSPRDRS